MLPAAVTRYAAWELRSLSFGKIFTSRYLTITEILAICEHMDIYRNRAISSEMPTQNKRKSLKPHKLYEISRERICTEFQGANIPTYE